MGQALDILLINPPERHFRIQKQLRPPLGLAVIAAILEQAGYVVRVLDCPTEGYGFSDLEAILRTSSPPVIGITSTTFTRFDAIQSAQVVRKTLPEATIVLGGVHASFTAHDTLDHISAIDVVCRGEGEETVLDIMQAVLKGGEFTQIQGVSYRKDDRVFHNPDRPFIQDLDSLPVLAYHLLPMDKYGQKMPFLDVPAALVMTSRGCPGTCAFCSTRAMWGSRIRSRSATAILDEIEFLFEEYGAQGVWLFDDTFTFKRAHVEAFVQEIHRRHLKFPWYCEVRVDTVDYDVLKLMRDAGCYYISFGIETATPRLLKKIAKGITIEQVERVINWANQLGIYVKAFFMLGLPEETYSEALSTIKYMTELRESGRVANPVLTHGLYILPGTPVERYAKKHGLVPVDFSWSEPYHNEELLTINMDPNVPVLIQPQLDLAALRKLKYEEIIAGEGAVRKMAARAVKRLSSLKGMKRYGKKYLTELPTISRWVLAKLKEGR